MYMLMYNVQLPYNVYMYMYMYMYMYDVRHHVSCIAYRDHQRGIGLDSSDDADISVGVTVKG